MVMILVRLPILIFLSSNFKTLITNNAPISVKPLGGGRGGGGGRPGIDGAFELS